MSLNLVAELKVGCNLALTLDWAHFTTDEWLTYFSYKSAFKVSANCKGQVDHFSLAHPKSLAVSPYYCNSHS